MALVAAGLLSKQIAAQINLSEITVKVHRSHIMRKIGARSVADLVRMAETLGLGQPSARGAPAPYCSAAMWMTSEPGLARVRQCKCAASRKASQQ
jgi:hypothetical protein